MEAEAKEMAHPSPSKVKPSTFFSLSNYK